MLHRIQNQLFISGLWWQVAPKERTAPTARKIADNTPEAYSVYCSRETDEHKQIGLGLEDQGSISLAAVIAHNVTGNAIYKVEIDQDQSWILFIQNGLIMPESDRIGRIDEIETLFLEWKEQSAIEVWEGLYEFSLDDDFEAHVWKSYQGMPRAAKRAAKLQQLEKLFDSKILILLTLFLAIMLSYNFAYKPWKEKQDQALLQELIRKENMEKEAQLRSKKNVFKNVWLETPTNADIISQILELKSHVPIQNKGWRVEYWQWEPLSTTTCWKRVWGKYEDAPIRPEPGKENTSIVKADIPAAGHFRSDPTIVSINEGAASLADLALRLSAKLLVKWHDPQSRQLKAGNLTRTFIAPYRKGEFKLSGIRFLREDCGEILDAMYGVVLTSAKLEKSYWEITGEIYVQK